MTIRELTLRNNKQILEILSLQAASYRVEAEIIGFNDIPLLQDGIQSLREAGEIFLGYYMDTENKSELVGVLSYSGEGSVFTICRMMVHPMHFRKGIASRLLRYFLADQKAKNASRFIVSTCSANGPAVNFYKSFGFTERRVRTIAPQVTLITFERPVDF